MCLLADGIVNQVFSNFLTYSFTSATHFHGCSLCFVSTLKTTNSRCSSVPGAAPCPSSLLLATSPTNGFKILGLLWNPKSIDFSNCAQFTGPFLFYPI